MGVNRIFLAALAVLLVIHVSRADDASDDVSSNQIRMASQIETIVKQIGDVPHAWVWVKIEPDLERWRAFVKTLAPPPGRAIKSPGSAIPQSVDVLPGVNTDEMAGYLNKREKESAAAKPAARSTGPTYDAAIKMAEWFQHVSVRIAVPETIAPERLAALRAQLPVLVGLRAQQGDVLIIRTIPEPTVVPAPPPPLPPAPETSRARFMHWLGQASPNAVALWVFLVALLLFCFGPIRLFLRELASALQLIRSHSQTSGTLETKGEPGNEKDQKLLERARRMSSSDLLALGRGTADEPEIFSEDMPKKGVGSKDFFGFINEERLSNVLQICRDETPEHIAMLVSYLKPAWAGRIMASLGAGVRQEVLSYFRQDGRFDPQAVTAFAAQLESTLPFVSGGAERLMALMEEMEPAARDAMLAELDRSLPEAARIIRSKMITYMDLFRIDRKDLQKLLWEGYRLKVGLPVLFASVSQKGQEYLIHQLPDSVADVLQSEIAAAGKPTPDRVEVAGRRLVQLARTLEKNGDIAPITKSGEAA